MYGCDCDGVRRQQLDTGGVEGHAIRATLKVIEDVAGHRPPTCAWRSLYEPIVREVLTIRWAMDGGGLASVLGPDPDYLLVQALGVYHRALKATEAEETRCQLEDARVKREAMRRAKGLRG